MRSCGAATREPVSDFTALPAVGRQRALGGVRFKDLLALAEPLPAAKAIRFVSLEQPYDDSLTLDQVRLGT